MSSDQAPEPEAVRLTEAELAYHQEVMLQMEGARAVEAHWSVHLGARYRLRPGDRIQADGTIVRTPAAEEP